MESCMKAVAFVMHFKQRQEILGIIAWKLRRGHISQEKEFWLLACILTYEANGGVQNIKCKIEPGLEEPQMPYEGIHA